MISFCFFPVWCQLRLMTGSTVAILYSHRGSHTLSSMKTCIFLGCCKRQGVGSFVTAVRDNFCELSLKFTFGVPVSFRVRCYVPVEQPSRLVESPRNGKCIQLSVALLRTSDAEAAGWSSAARSWLMPPSQSKKTCSQSGRSTIGWKTCPKGTTGLQHSLNLSEGNGVLAKQCQNVSRPELGAVTARQESVHVPN